MKDKQTKVDSAGRTNWLDETAQTPLIDQYAQRMGSFIEAMADGKIDAAEVKAQETRLVSLMKEVEPKLDANLHGQVTQLLCELTVYNLMQMLHTMQNERPKTKFHG